MTTHSASMLASGGLGSPVSAFLLVTCCAFFLCLVIGVRDADDRTADFFAADRSLPMVQNALAMSGDYILVTSLSAPVGMIALNGYDGLVAAACAVTGLVMLALLAEPLRNTGQFTLGGVLERRTPGSRVRIAGGVVTLVVCVPLTVVQLTVAGHAISFLLGLHGSGSALACTVMIGLLMITFAAFGGMRGSSMLAAGKALLLFAVLAAAALVVVRRFDWSLGALLSAAAQGSGRGDAFGTSGLLFGASSTGRLEFISVCLAVTLGSSVLPMMLMRVSASRNGRSSRRSVRHATLYQVLFWGVLVVLGLGAAALVGGAAIGASDATGNTALLMLSAQISGGREGLMFTFLSCAVFLASLGSVAGLTLAGAASLVRDVIARERLRVWVSEGREVATARWTVVGLGVMSVLLAVVLHQWRLVFLVSFAVTVAASVILPTLLKTLFGRGVTRTGTLWSLYGGLACCIVLQLGSPTVSGTPTALFPDLDFQWFPLQNIGVVTVPVGFLLAWAGSRFSRRAATDGADHAASEVRTLTGIDIT
ncbi:cation acetate symporter [Streptomyces sp. NPDC029041]|uniref:sodium:solute symporter family transporter n=1 Tax=Streptomyces sp. NPDC029041 TaxID=3155727 RepID=UPI0033C8105D